jgi:hypothetical protein
VTRRRGQGRPLESTAARTRSRASRTGVGQADDGEAWEPVGDVNLQRNGASDGAARGAEAIAAGTQGNGRTDGASDARRAWAGSSWSRG